MVRAITITFFDVDFFLFLEYDSNLPVMDGGEG